MARTNLLVEERFRFLPRNTGVLVRITDKGQLRGIAIPEISIEGKEFTVVAIGPKVEGLKVGDKVLMRGVRGAEFFEIPFDKRLIFIEEKDVVLVIEKLAEDEE